MRVEQLFAIAAEERSKRNREANALVDVIFGMLGDDREDFTKLRSKIRDNNIALGLLGELKRNKRMTRESLGNCNIDNLELIGLTRDQVFSIIERENNVLKNGKLNGYYTKYSGLRRKVEELELLMADSNAIKMNMNSSYGSTQSHIRNYPDGFSKKFEDRTPKDFDEMQRWTTANSNLLYGAFASQPPSPPDSMKLGSVGFALEWCKNMECAPPSLTDFQREAIQEAIHNPNYKVIVLDSVPERGEDEK